MHIILLILLSFIGSVQYAKTTQNTLVQHISKRTSLNKKEFTVSLYDINTQKWLVKHNINKLFIPASVNKLFTTAGALHILKQGFRFKTKIYTDYKKENFRIEGGGDPIFVSENLWILVNKLASYGIKTVKGNIYLDNSLFKSYKLDKGDRAYATTVAPLSLNFNSFALNILTGQKPLMHIEPPIKSIHIRDYTKKTKFKTFVHLKRQSNILNVYGRISNEQFITTPSPD